MIDRFNPLILGDYLKKTTAGDFVLVEAIHQSGFEISKHVHEHTGITVTTQGSFTQRFGRRSVECVSDSIQITPLGEAHSNQYGSAGARCLHIKVNPKRTEALRAVSNALERPAYIQGRCVTIFERKIKKELKIMDSASMLAIESMILEMLAHITRTYSRKISPLKPPEWLCAARDFIHACFDQQISLNDVANSVGMNAAHLARMFRKYYHVSVGEYVRCLRLDYAARQLSHSEQTLIEIAYSSGFYDQSHFSHLFKLQTGITPTEFRKITKSGKSDTNGT